MNNIDKKYPKVEVLWEDIVNFSRLSLEDLTKDADEYRLYKKEIGYLIKKTDEILVIVNDLDLEGGSDNYGTIFPIGCIRNIKELHENTCKESNKISKLINKLIPNKKLNLIGRLLDKNEDNNYAAKNIENFLRKIYLMKQSRIKELENIIKNTIIDLYTDEEEIPDIYINMYDKREFKDLIPIDKSESLDQYKEKIKDIILDSPKMIDKNDIHLLMDKKRNIIKITTPYFPNVRDLKDMIIEKVEFYKKWI